MYTRDESHTLPTDPDSGLSRENQSLDYASPLVHSAADPSGRPLSPSSKMGHTHSRWHQEGYWFHRLCSRLASVRLRPETLFFFFFPSKGALTLVHIYRVEVPGCWVVHRSPSKKAFCVPWSYTSNYNEINELSPDSKCLSCGPEKRYYRMH